METTREDELDESWVPGTVVLTDGIDHLSQE